MLCADVHVFHASVFQTAVRLTVVGEASTTPMPKTILELAHGFGDFVITIHCVIRIGNAIFTHVSCMLNTMEL